MKKLSFLLLAALVAVIFASCGKTYKYESVEGDPLKTRIYTLDNGLKVYLSVYKDAPRIQTYIAVRAGGKNDPAETTGLAHYLEHLLFKGTTSFGTSDYAAEKPLLDSIVNLYELYRSKTDPAERKAIYAQIDATAQEAAKYAIANEYDKLMATIGASATNAHTSEDETVYQEDIPSNQIENWAKIQADRFENPVFRLFHTELETVYEEKNRSMNHDGFRLYETLYALLYPNYSYGTQTVIGTQEHLKNPSLVNIKNYFDKYYIPNNMAITMSGDFNPDEAIKIIDRYFGKLKRGEDIVQPKFADAPFTAPVEKTITGKDADELVMAWRIDAKNNSEILKLKLMDMVLTNGHAGLIDLNVRQKQLLLKAGSQPDIMAENQSLILMATPKEGQTLEQARDILLEQVNKLKAGDFPDWLLPAVVNDFKLSEIRGLEYNYARASAMYKSFINQTEWKDEVAELDNMEKITKDEVVAFANEKLQNNYVIVYKKHGKTDELAIDKPEITAVNVNRDSVSAFVREVQLAKVKPIEPVFIDFKKDITFLTTNGGVPVLYKQNSENALFELEYVYDMGSDNDKELSLAVSYLQYLGTEKYTPEQIKEEFYKLGCNYGVSTSNDRLYVYLNGLAENMTPALQLFEHLLNNAVVNEAAYTNLVGDMLKSRGDAKLNNNTNFARLRSYGVFGAFSPATNILGENDLKAINPQRLVDKIKTLGSYKHKVLYYGGLTAEKFVAEINAEHKIALTLADYPAATVYTEQPTDKNTVIYAHYDAPQAMMALTSKKGSYDPAKEPIITMFNEYFGGGMNSIVFQEIREARALAYSANATYGTASRPDRSNYMYAVIGTQTDKLKDAVAAFRQILDTIPQSEKAFDIAKEAIISNLRTQRITKSNILWQYLWNERWGIDHDLRKDVFEQVPDFTLADVVKFQQENVRNSAYTFCVLGNEKTIDFSALKALGEVKTLTQKEIFGY
ncbi:MAG: insulinase family protein [Paludibacter sp.]|jgi:predicted Zn-dependent peptidase|nr:insulinase family protein [Paludibacter sp.]